MNSRKFIFFFILPLFLIAFSCMAADVARRISFERDDGIYVANLDGTAVRKLAPGNLAEISPDGTRVAFNTDEPGKATPVRHIAVADVNSGKMTVFRDLPGDNAFGPVWSPDGKSLLFNILVDKDWQLGFVNADGTGFRIVKKAQAQDRSYYMPAWAGDGKSFYCHDLDSIYQFTLEGNLLKKWDIHTIVDNGDMNSNSRIAVSPDGKSLLMDIDMNEDNTRDNWDGPPPAIWLLTFAASKAVRLTDKGLFAWDPFWINANEYIFMSQGPKENEPSLYRAFTNQKSFSLVLKNARTPSASAAPQ